MVPGSLVRTTGLAIVGAWLIACGGTAPIAPSNTAPVSSAARLSCTLALSDCSSVMVGQDVTFTADPGSTTVGQRASLDFGDGTTTDLGPLSSATRIPHTYTRVGSFTARLLLAGVQESSSPTQTVRVDTLVLATMSATAIGGLNVAANADVRGATVLRYDWIFDPRLPAVTTTTPEARFTYETAGWKDVAMHATLADGRTVTASSSVVVE